MQREICDLCSLSMELHTHYVVRIDVFADPAMPSTTSAQLAATDFNAEMSKLLDEMKNMTQDELADQVHRRFEYKICPACHAKFLANPLGKPRVLEAGRN